MDLYKKKKPMVDEDNNSNKVLIPHPPAIKAGVEESLPMVTFRTTQLRKDRLRRNFIRSSPLAPQSKFDCHEKLALYSTSYIETILHDHDTCVYKVKNTDPILEYITAQRSKLCLDTVAKSDPNEIGTSGSREFLMASSAPIAGVKDLQQFSRKLLTLQGEQKNITKDVTNDFIYALRKDQDGKSRLNPYDLCIVSFDKARQQNRYFTISALSVAEFDRKKGLSDTTHVLRWLYERDMFQKITAIPIIKKFKILRTFVGWRRWIRTKKYARYTKSIRIDLFLSDELLQKALLQVQDICESVSSSSTEDYLHNYQQKEISLISFHKDKTLTLEDFMCLQTHKCSEAKDSLIAVREKIIQVVFDALKGVTDKEKMYGFHSDEARDSFEEPTCTQILEWRFVLKKLRGFEKVCSNLILRLLQRLVLKAIATLERGIRRSIKKASSLIEKQVESCVKMREEVASHPFTQNVMDRTEYAIIDQEKQDLELLKDQASFFSDILCDSDMDIFSVTDLLGKDSPSGSVTSFHNAYSVGIDLTEKADLANMDLAEKTDLADTEERADLADTEEKDLADTEEKTDLADTEEKAEEKARLVADTDLADTINDILQRKRPVPILPLWEVQLQLILETKDERCNAKVKFTPSADDFHNALQHLLNMYEEVLSSFVPISNDSRIKPFTKCSKYDLLMTLEEQHTQKMPSKWPDLENLLHEYGPYKQSLSYINKALSITLNNILELSRHFKCYSLMVRSCSGVDITTSLRSEEWTVSMFQRIFAFFHDQVHAMDNMVTSFIVGMVGVEGKDFKGSCLTYPQTILQVLEYEFPILVANKASSLAKNIKESTDKMLVNPATVETFVLFISDVEEVEEVIPQYEKRLGSITSLYGVAQHFEVPISERDTAVYRSIFPQFRILKSALMQAQATKSENVYHFSTEIKTQMVALLHKAMEVKAKSESQALQEESLSISSTKPLEELSILKSELDYLVEKALKYVEYHHIFAKIPTSKRHYQTLDTVSWSPEEVCDEVKAIQQSLQTRQTLFKAKAEWDVKVASWLSVKFQSMAISTVQQSVNTFIKTIDHLKQNIPSSNMLLQVLHDEVVEFRSYLPTLTCLLNSSLKFRHWEAIKDQTGGNLELRRGSSLTLADLKEMGIFEHHEAISTVSNQANHEETLENMLKKISDEWSNKEFDLVAYKGFTDRLTYILGGVEDLFASLEDSLTVLNIINSSKFVEPIKHAVLDWNHRLALTLETVEYWVLCQKNWLYLENIFSTVDMQRQLSAESRLFLQADRTWRETIRNIAEKPTALKAATTPGILEAFQSCNAILEQVFKSLEDYLEAKRYLFPRLNFISNSELLDILSHARELASVQPYLCKLFGNIKRLEFCKEVTVSPPIVAMVSAEDEKIHIIRKCFTRGSPEYWLSIFEQTMQNTVNDLLQIGIGSYSPEVKTKWLMEQPGQVVITASQINWTCEVESCLKSHSQCEELKNLHQCYVDDLASTATLLNDETLLPFKRSVISSLLTLNVHDRDVISSLINNGVTSNKDFEWIRHLRYFWDNDARNCYMHQCCATLRYGMEYLGCLPRLVITPLSERCYLTLTTAMHLHLGGSPIGPAGTGKSETVKDLAKAVGQLCLVINCSEGLDYKMMGRYFSGVCQSGIWCCFDEFNRIDVEVLSVVAQQLGSIKNAKDNRLTKFVFEGKDIKLQHKSAVCITMNPGYTGRVELPDNLKSYFRPVAMMVPDTSMITEVLLFTNCFTTASVLALKLTMFYDMIKAQISSQKHYDFGLRSVKAVISLAGEYMKRNTRDNADQSTLEKYVLLSALRNNTLPRLVSKDVPTVQMLLWDLFHDADEENEDEDHTKLKDYIEAAVVKNSLEYSSSQVQKCHELYSILLVRHGVMLLGPTGGGKTTVLKLLESALNQCYSDYYGPKSFQGISKDVNSMASVASVHQILAGKSQHCQLQIINPKSISTGELYGYSDKFTLEWKNGILACVLLTFCNQTETEMNYFERSKSVSQASSSGSTISREVSKELLESTSSLHKFGLPYPPCAPVGWRLVSLDGPVDSEWIENLNSVLDDSKVLCLSNGERIRLLPGSKILFESDDLSNASPATVSRCGMIFLDPCELGWKPIVLSWIKNLPDDLPDKCKEHILTLFEHSIDSGLNFLKEHSSKLSCAVPGISAVKSLCSILGGLLRSLSEDHGGLEIKTEVAQEEVVKKGLKDSSSHLQGRTFAGIYIPTRPNVSTGEPKKKKSLEVSTVPAHRRSLESLCKVICNLFVFSYVWAFGGCFESAEENNSIDLASVDAYEPTNDRLSRGGVSVREKFDKLVYNLFTKDKVIAQLPSSTGLIYSYYFNITNNQFEPWKNLISTPSQNVSFMSTDIDTMYSSQRSMFKLFSDATKEDCYTASDVSLIPTVDIVRLLFLISVLFESNSTSNVLISGKYGVGKTQLLTHLSKALPSRIWRKSVISKILGASLSLQKKISSMNHDLPEDHTHIPAVHHISNQLQSAGMQSLLERYLMRQGRTILIPTTGKMILACLDDLNAGSSDDYGCKSSLELLRQLISNQGWYDRKKLLWKNVVGMNFLATCHAGVSGANSISERLLSKFHLLNLPEAGSESLLNIYSSHVLKSFQENKFCREVLHSTRVLIACSIFVFSEVRNQLTPTPMKPQYMFCLKDLSKVFTGLLRLNNRGLTNREELARLLVNELARVFHDRCIYEDREKLLNIISDGLRISFKILQSSSQLSEQLEDLKYCNFIDTVRGYSLVKSNKKLVKYLEKMQTQQNISEDKDSHLVFFPLACEHIIRMSRVLQLQRGHILLIGLGGVGRRSCVEIAAYITNLNYCTLPPIHGHTPFSEFMDELKLILRDCAMQNQPTLVLAADGVSEDHQESFFSVLNELIVGRQMLELFEKDEVDGILNMLAEELLSDKSSMKRLSPVELKKIFSDRIIQNLHVVLCLTPLSSEMAQIRKKFPCLMTHTTVDVFDEWPSEALYSVAVKELQKEERRHGELMKDMYSHVASLGVKIHEAVLAAKKSTELMQLSFIVTPFTFIQYVQTFNRLLLQQYRKLNIKRLHLEFGVSRLSGADEKVVQMNSELQELKPQVLAKAEEIEILLQQLAAEQKGLDVLRAIVYEERMEIAKETDHVASLAREAEKDLETVLPALKAAEKDLHSLKKSDLSEIRFYATPPTMVMTVMSAVCTLLREPSDWASIKHIMADTSTFLKRLTGFNKNDVPDKILSKLKNYTNDPNFTPERVSQYSVACKSFCMWVLAIEHYCKVYKVMQPKRKLQQQMSAELEELVGKLQAKEVQLHELESQMVDLTQKLEQKQNDRDELQDKYKEIESNLIRAEVLMKSLGDEEVRWKETLSDLQSKTSTLIGDTLLLSSCYNYLGPFTPALRQSLLSTWMQLCLESTIPCDSNFSLEGLMDNSKKIQKWYVQGLPKDTQSVQNAIILTEANKCLFIIDPQQQAVKWLKSMLSKSNLLVVDYRSAKLINYLGQATRVGLPLMVTGVSEQLSSLLDPFMQKLSFHNSGQRTSIQIGKTEIPYNPSFQLYLMNINSSAKLPSDTCTKTTVINFSATIEGFQDQLLSITIHMKEPDLECQYNDLLLTINKDVNQLEKLEQRLLDCLSSSEGQPLEDDDLVNVLKDTTHTAKEVKQRLLKAFETKEIITSSRLKYERVAARGSVLFFSVLALCNLNPVYVFSSDWFIDMFTSCVDSIHTPSDTSTESFEEYLDKIVEHLTITIYQRVSYGIFSKHCLPFVFKLCAMLLMHEDESLKSPTSIKNSEWAALVCDSLLPETDPELHMSPHTKHKPSSKTLKLKPEEISFEAWESAVKLDKTLPAFTGLLVHIISNKDSWIQFSRSDRPWQFKFEDEEVPANTADRTGSKRRSSTQFSFADLNRFQMLLLINIFCPKQFYASAEWFIESEMGLEYTIAARRDLETIYQQTSRLNPALIIITPNVDPTAQLKLLAEEKSEHLDIVSLGQGQGEIAVNNVWFAAKRAHWVFLQNCHLALSWMSQLEALVKELQVSSHVSKDFRLWLSCDSTTVLPPVLLQSSIKICLEAPTSVKSNMHQLLSLGGTAVVSSGDFERCPILEWQQLVYRLCLFHSAANTRRRYGSEGWRTPYVFGPNDLQVSIQLLQSVFIELREEFNDVIPWSAVHHIVGEICYGGKITDSQDSRALRALLNMYCSPQSLSKGYNHESKSVTPGLTYKGVTKLVDDLPNEDEPSILGLNPVLHSTIAANDSKSLHSTLSLLETVATHKSYKERTRDSFVLEKAKELLEKLPPSIKPLHIPISDSQEPSQNTTEPISIWKRISPFWILLSNEVLALNEKVIKITSLLNSVISGIKGECVEDQLFQHVYKALAENMSPDSWKFERDAPSSLPDWLDWFMKQYIFIEKWVTINSLDITNDNFTSSPKLPSKIMLPALKYIHGFFEAVKQSYSRKTNIPVEDITIRFDDATQSNEIDGIIISGLRIGLAEWDSDRGLVQTTQMEQYTLMPDMVCCPVQKNGKETKQNLYHCPLYSSSAKLEFISNLVLRTKEQPGHLDLTGVTLIV